LSTSFADTKIQSEVSKLTDINFEAFKKGVTLFKVEKDDLSEKELHRMAKNKVHLILHLPFFRGLIGVLDLVPTRQIEKFGADYRKWYFNPDYTKEQSDRDLRGNLLHSVLHLIFQHIRRKGNRHIPIWMLATEINADLLSEETLNDLENRHLLQKLQLNNNDTSYVDDDFREVPVEEIYEKLMQEFNEMMDQMPASGKGSYGEDMKEKSETAGKAMADKHGNPSSACSIGEVLEEFNKQMDTNMESMEQERWQQKVNDEVRKNKERGLVPSSIESMVNILEEPAKIDWRQMLHYYVQATIVHDVSWRRLNKGMAGSGIYLPAIEKNNMEVTVAVDTSGSVSDQELAEFINEVSSILNTIANVKMTILDCDAAVQQEFTIEYGEVFDPANKTWKGRGGTAFQPVFDYIEKKIEKGVINAPEVLIYFTDGYGDNHSMRQPPYQVLWLCNGAEEDAFPFGTYIPYDSEYSSSW